MSNINIEYWASVGPSEIADRVLQKVDDYYEYLSLCGRLDMYQRSWLYYYRPRLTGGMMTPTGEQGELTAISVNQYRNLLLHLETMTTQQKAAFEPMAINSDTKSQSQVILASSLLDYYMYEKKLERKLKMATKDCLIFGEAFVRKGWDATSGKVYGQAPTGAPIYEGDMSYKEYTPLDMIRDFTLTSPESEIWRIPRDFENKFDLAAKFPDLKEQILECSADMMNLARTTTLNFLAMDQSDNIPVYTLLHEISPAMPQGRFTRVLENGTVLMDGPLPYDSMEIDRIAPDEETGTIFGYTVGFDLLAVQEALDMLYSTVLSNQAAHGVQNILVPKGHDLSTSQIAGGLNLMEFDPNIGKPEALNLTNTPAEIFNFMNHLEVLGETLSAVNSVARGNPEASLKSGAALALVQSMAIQFNMGLQQSYAQLVSDTGTGTIRILQTYASVPRVAMIVGKSNRPLMKEFQGSDLDQIHRVRVDMGNPMTKTTAGKVQLADTFMQNGLIENTDQYIQVVTTGRLEPVIEGKQANLLLIKGENEMLADGKPQRALLTDNHAKHILEHSAVLANPEIRATPDDPIVQATLAHIQEHINYAQSPGYQLLAASLGHQILVPPAPAPAPPALPAGPGGAGATMNPATPVSQAAAQVNMPNMPKPPVGTDPQSAEVINQQAGRAPGA